MAQNQPGSTSTITGSAVSGTSVTLVGNGRLGSTILDNRPVYWNSTEAALSSTPSPSAPSWYGGLYTYGGTATKVVFKNSVRYISGNLLGAGGTSQVACYWVDTAYSTVLSTLDSTKMTYSTCIVVP